VVSGQGDSISEILARHGSRLDILALDHGRHDVARIVRALPGLRMLRLEFLSLDDIVEDARALGEHRGLRALELVGTSFRRGIQDFVAVDGLRSLTHLRLWGAQLDDSALTFLLHSPLARRLQYLDLRNNPITKTSAAALAELAIPVVRMDPT
jgi:hypothetical protein